MYIDEPGGSMMKDEEDEVCRLKKVLYCLKELAEFGMHAMTVVIMKNDLSNTTMSVPFFEENEDC